MKKEISPAQQHVDMAVASLTDAYANLIAYWDSEADDDTLAPETASRIADKIELILTILGISPEDLRGDGLR